MAPGVAGAASVPALVIAEGAALEAPPSCSGRAGRRGGLPWSPSWPGSPVRHVVSNPVVIFTHDFDQSAGIPAAPTAPPPGLTHNLPAERATAGPTDGPQAGSPATGAPPAPLHLLGRGAEAAGVGLQGRQLARLVHRHQQEGADLRGWLFRPRAVGEGRVRGWCVDRWVASRVCMLSSGPVQPHHPCTQASKQALQTCATCTMASRMWKSSPPFRTGTWRPGTGAAPARPWRPRAAGGRRAACGERAALVGQRSRRHELGTRGGALRAAPASRRQRRRPMRGPCYTALPPARPNFSSPRSVPAHHMRKPQATHSTDSRVE